MVDSVVERSIIILAMHWQAADLEVINRDSIIGLKARTALGLVSSRIHFDSIRLLTPTQTRPTQVRRRLPNTLPNGVAEEVNSPLLMALD